MSQNETNFGEPIDRLLRAYEVTMQMLSFLMELHAKGGSHEYAGPFWHRIANGPINHWNHLRESLLKIHTGNFDLEKFVGPSMKETIDDKKDHSSFMRARLLASEVASWTKSSRRVYRIPKELELLLAATSLKDVDWSMIRWPFDSFLISLEEPLVFREKTITSILVSKINSGSDDIRVFHAITTDLPTMEVAFVGNQRTKIEQALKKGDPDSLVYAGEKLAPAMARMKGGGAFFMVTKDCFEPNGAAALFEKEGGLFKDNDIEGKTIFRIVFGLLLYLQSRPPAEVIGRDWQSSKYERSSGPGRLIRVASEVCLVKSAFLLKDHEREVLEPILRGISVELSTHYREGHWRRPPGKGADPTYPKSVWVCPTIVRKDKLSEGGLPVGSTEIIS